MTSDNEKGFPAYLRGIMDAKKREFEALGEPTVKEKPLFTVTDHPFHVRNKVGIPTEFPIRSKRK